MNISKEVHQRTKDFMAEAQVHDRIVPYHVAMRTVLDADPDLKRQYTGAREPEMRQYVESGSYDVATVANELDLEVKRHLVLYPYLSYAQAVYEVLEDDEDLKERYHSASKGEK